MTLRRTLTPLAVFLVALATQACAGARTEVAAPSADAKGSAPKSAKASGKDAAAPVSSEADEAEAIVKAPTLGRAVGDYIVYEFSGSFRKAKATLTERVVARTDATVSVLVTLSEAAAEAPAKGKAAKAGPKTETLRVTFAEKNGARGEVLEVSRADGEGFTAAELGDYDALVAKVTLTADDNEALLGEEESERTIAGEALACRTASYRVRVGKKIATLRTIETRDVAWGDVGGEITDEKGAVLFRAEVVKLGREAPAEGLAALR